MIAVTAQTFLTLNDGRSMPQVGLGVWQSPADITADTVATALAAGYLAISAVTMLIVVWTERGRLFQPHHQDDAIPAVAE